MRLIIVCWLAALSTVSFAQTGDWIPQNGPYGGKFSDVEYDAVSGWTYALINKSLYYSEDFGDTWTRSGSFIDGWDIEIGGGTVYVLQATFSINVYTSAAGQDNFVDVTSTGPGSGTRIKRMSNGNLVVLRQFDVYVSTDNGVSFSAGASISGGAIGSMLEVTSDNKVVVINAGTNVVQIIANPASGIFANFSSTPAITGTVTSIETNNARTTLFVATTATLFETPATGGGTLTTIENGTATATTLSSVTYPSIFEVSADGAHVFFIDNFNHRINFKTVSGGTWADADNSPATGLTIISATAKNVNELLIGSYGEAFNTTNVATGTFNAVHGGIEVIGPKQFATFGESLFLTNLQDPFDLEPAGTYFRNGSSWVAESRIPGGVASFSGSKDYAANPVDAALALKHLPTFGTSDLYRSFFDGAFTFTNWALVGTAPDFEWVDLMDGQRGIGMLFTANSPLQYTHDNGATWGVINVSGLPGSYDFNPPGQFFGDHMSMASATQMFVKEQVTDNFYRINFNVSTGPPFSGTATNIHSLLPSGFTNSNIDKAFAKNGKFYLFEDSSSPDRFAVSSDGGNTWVVRNAPGSNTDFWVADNGYIFIVERFDERMHMSRDNGASFIMTTLPSTMNSQGIEDVFVDREGYAWLALNSEVVHRSKFVVALPASPTDLQSVGITSNSIALRWKDEAFNEQTYLIERSLDAVVFTSVGVVSGGDMCQTPSSRGFFVDTSLTPGTNYTYRVTARNEAGDSNPVINSFTTLAACSPQSIPDGHSWTATNAGGNGFAPTVLTNVGIRHVGNGRYEVESMDMGLAPPSSAVKSKFILDCDKTVVLADANGTIQPNGVGTWNGALITVKWAICEDLNSFETVTFAQNAPNTDPPPTAPVVQALVAGNSQVDITWTTGFNQKDFLVERSTTSPSTGFSQIGGSSVVDYPGNSFTDPGPFTAGSPYYYRVTARNHNLPIPLTTAGNAELVFANPNFVISASDVSSHVGSMLGSYWGDFDGDSHDDLLGIDGDLTGSETSLLIFRNLGDGTFQQQAVSFDDELYVSAAIIDINNDNHLDIAVHEGDGSFIDLYQGNGDFTFVKLSPALVGDLATNIQGEILSMSWADANRDGLLDVLVCAEDESGSNVIPPQLFLRNAGGTYTKTSAGDLDYYSTEASFGAWADYNNDRNPDLLIVDSDVCNLYTGNGDGTFTYNPSSDIIDNGTAAAWGDYSGDGNIDLFISRTSNSVLYKNNGDGSFTRDATTAVTSATTSFGLSPVWIDINNDRRLDLVTSAFIFGQNTIYINTTSGSQATFNKITTEKISESPMATSAVAASDYDKNGFLDLSLARIFLDINSGETAPVNYNLYRNQNTAGNWVEVRLQGSTNNTQGLGARVRVHNGGTSVYRQVLNSASLRAQSSSNLHFGLGTMPEINAITVEWPSGLTQVYTNPPINTAITIVEDADPPLVTLLNPANGATGVGVNASVEITFDEPTVANFIPTNHQIYVHRVSDGVQIFNQSVGTGVQNGNKFTFTFGGPMQQLTEYEVSFDAGAFSDIYGNVFAGLASPWRFTTSAGPQMTTLHPLNNAVNVPSNTTIAITFNLPTTPVAGKFMKIYNSSDLVIPLRTIEVTNAVATGNTQTFTMTPNLLTEVNLTVIVDPGAFKDAGNAVSSGGQWSFTTMAGPKVTTLLPADEAQTVAANTTLEITFDQVVTAEAGKKIRIYKSPEVNPVFETDVTSGSIAGTKVTFVVTPKLAGQSNFTVVVDNFAFRDAIGNLSLGISSTQWNFRTDQGPTPISVIPVAGAMNVSTTASIEITFDRALSAGVAGKRLQVMDGTATILNADVSSSGTIAGTKFTASAPPGQWPAGKVLTIGLDNGAFVDAGGNESSGFAVGTYSFTTEVGPVIQSRKPTVGETGVALNAAIEIIFDKNVTAVPNKKIEVLDGNTAIVSSNVVSAGILNGDAYTHPAPTGGWPLDKVLRITLEAGAFVDVGGKPSQAITGTDWTFRTLVAPDATAPSIVFTPVGTVNSTALPTSLSATVSDNVSVQSTKLFIRPISGSQFVEINGNNSGAGTNYLFTFANSPFDAIGIQFYFTATDGSSNAARSPQTGYHQTYIRYAAPAIPSGLVGSGGQPTGWKVIAIPFDLGNNNAVSSVFDELFSGTPALQYKKDWRLLTLTNTPTLKWLDYNEGFTNVDRGTGYFINIRTLKALSPGSDLTAPDNRRDNLFKYTLRAGWNMIGNPYLTQINWTNVVALNTGLQGTSGTVLKKFSNGNYADVNLLQAFEGGFVQVPSQIEITIPFEGQITSGGREKEIVFEEGDWIVPITLRKDGLENVFGGVGMHHESTQAFDMLDNFNGPQFIDFIEMNFEHPNDFPRRFARDVVGTRDEYMWEFTVDANGEGHTQMSWDRAIALPSGTELYLWDPAKHAAVNMQETGSYEFDPAVSRKFRIHFGKDARHKIKPETALLGMPFPNPSAGISYIPYSLPEGNLQYGVKIEVFDMMGRRVEIIEDGVFAAGLHQSTWNPQETIGNGLYTIRMTVVTDGGQDVYSDRIVLNK